MPEVSRAIRIEVLNNGDIVMKTDSTSAGKGVFIGSVNQVLNNVAEFLGLVHEFVPMLDSCPYCGSRNVGQIEDFVSPGVIEKHMCLDTNCEQVWSPHLRPAPPHQKVSND